MFSSPHIISGSKLPVSNFLELMADSESGDIKNQMAGAADLLLETISEDGLVDLIAFADIIDLYVYFPVHLPNTDKYKSEEIHKVVNYQAGLV